MSINRYIDIMFAAFLTIACVGLLTGIVVAAILALRLSA